MPTQPTHSCTIKRLCWGLPFPSSCGNAFQILDGNDALPSLSLLVPINSVACTMFFPLHHFIYISHSPEIFIPLPSSLKGMQMTPEDRCLSPMLLIPRLEGINHQLFHCILWGDSSYGSALAP